MVSPSSIISSVAKRYRYRLRLGGMGAEYGLWKNASIQAFAVLLCTRLQILQTFPTIYLSLPLWWVMMISTFSYRCLWSLRPGFFRCFFLMFYRTFQHAIVLVFFCPLSRVVIVPPNADASMYVSFAHA